MGVAPGRGVIMCAPVSVCHHVSTTDTLPLPTTSWYQRQASGLMGSPTVPRMRSEVRLRRQGSEGAEQVRAGFGFAQQQAGAERLTDLQLLSCWTGCPPPSCQPADINHVQVRLPPTHLCLVTCWSPQAIRVRMAVGAV